MRSGSGVYNTKAKLTYVSEGSSGPKFLDPLPTSFFKTAQRIIRYHKKKANVGFIAY
jgi:hypothetical protein